MEYGIKLAAALPKEEGANGLDDAFLAQELVDATTENRKIRPRVAVLIWDVQSADVSTNGKSVAKVRVRRWQNVTTVDGRRAVEGLLRDEYVSEHGDHIPFDLNALSKVAFGDLPRETDEIDQQEEAERDRMTPADELRRHLERVHGVEGVDALTDGEVEAQHAKDHEGEMLGILAHDVEWIGWTRADLEEATADSDDDNGDEVTGEPDGQLTIGDVDLSDDQVATDEADTDDSPGVPAAQFSGSENE